MPKLFVMKKIYFLLVVILGFGSVSGQIINFPDAAFKNRLLVTDLSEYVAMNLQDQWFVIDSNSDGEIDVLEAAQVKILTLNNFAGGTVTNLSGIEHFTSLVELNVSSNNLSGNLSLPILPNLKKFKCFSNDLTSITLNGFSALEVLVCSQNDITTLNLTNLPNLKQIFAGNNEILYLDASSFTNLEDLDISSNPTTSLIVSGLSQLKSLEASTTSISTINLQGLTAIQRIEIDNSNLTTLDVSNLITLTTLDCSDNNIVNLNVSGATALKTLTCYFNATNNLDLSGLTALETLRCQNSGVVTLNLSGAIKLKFLNCRDNYITSLNLSGLTKLTTLDVYNNDLTTLDLSDVKAYSINVNENPLQSLFIKNGFENFLNLNSITTLNYICKDDFDTPLVSIPVEINSYCTFTPGGTFYTISGTNTFDSNNNGCTSSDPTFPNLKFNITNGNIVGDIISNQTGNYSIPVQSGTHTIIPIIENPTYFNISPASETVTFNSTSSPFTQNFCITPNGLHPDLEIVIVLTTPARPGFDTDYKLVIKNKGNIQQSGNVNLTYNEDFLDYVSSSPLFTTQATGLLTWDYSNLKPFETREISLTLNVNSPIETPAVNGGDILNYTATISSPATDDLPLDNTFSLPQIVVNSFDPNDKTCLEGTSITPDMIGTYVHYMIRFENTGTFAAENIVVKDMIDQSKFDISTLIPLNASHDFITRITGNKVEFIFENINLPFNNATNDGYIVFKIKTLPTLVLGDSFSNSASIYFDYNFPIVTDTAVTTFAVLENQDFEFNKYLILYPNPVNDLLKITSKQNIELRSMEIYNMIGQLVISVPNANGISSIDISSLSTGNYFLKVVSDKGTSNIKFIKN